MQFRYAARTLAGERVGGLLTAPDQAAAVAILHVRSLFITRIEPQTAWNLELRLPRLFDPGGTRAYVTFFRSFATLIGAGIGMRRALGVAIDRCDDEPLRATLRLIIADIERGESLSAALERRPKHFPPMIVAMIAAGEAGGVLDDVLERVATILERDRALRTSVLSALAYPATVLVTAIVLVVFLIVRVVPMFADLFASFHADLPPSTRALLWLGTTLDRPLPWVVGGIASLASFAAWRWFRQTPDGSLVLDRLRLAMPVAGTLLRKTIHARFAGILATLVRSGVELTLALDVVTPITESPVHARALRRVSEALRNGEAITPPLQSSGVFDPMLIALVGVGEETGMLDAMLAKAADYFEADVAATIATLAATVEPAFILVLGAIVGFIVYSVYIPLYSLIGSIAK